MERVAGYHYARGSGIIAKKWRSVSRMKIRAIYEEGVLKPLDKLKLKEREEVELKIISSTVGGTKGIIKISPGLAKEIAESEELSLLGLA